MKTTDRPSAGAVALVTGASSGIGYQYARQLAAQGYALVIVSNEQERIASVGETLRHDFGVPVTALYRDLSRADAAEELYHYCQAEHLPVEILINNAGIFFFDDVTTVSPRRIQLMNALHVQTPSLLCHYFGKEMAQRGRGWILNMASMSAWMPFPGITVYTATKSYLLNFSKALHNELYDQGVTVTAVCPGAVATDLYNLSRNYQKLALHLGIMMTPEALARKGLRALFHRRRSVIPGVINWLFVPLTMLLPSYLVRWIKRKAGFYRYGR